MPTPVSGGAIRRLLHRLGTSEAELEAAELAESARESGATPVERCACGEVVTISGPLRSVTLLPVAGTASLEAELYDGTGRVSLVWMGRRRIRGIEPGRVLTATGRLNTVDGRQVIFNPRYALRPVLAGE